MKELSAGVILTDGTSILGCRPFGRLDKPGNYDLPKGHWEEGESMIETALREMKEETGYEVPAEWLIDMGRWDYIPKKDLHLFVCVVDALPDPSTLRCSTNFDYKGQSVPECVAYKHIPIESLEWFFPSLEKVVDQVLQKLPS